MIVRWGKKSKLVRAGVKRDCWVARNEYKPTERALYLDSSERLFVSAYQLSVGPDFELDKIEFDGKLYRITIPPAGPRPNGLVIFYDCNCVSMGPAT